MKESCAGEVREQRCVALQQWSEKLQKSRLELMELLDALLRRLHRAAQRAVEHQVELEPDALEAVHGLLETLPPRVGETALGVRHPGQRPL